MSFNGTTTAIASRNHIEHTHKPANSTSKGNIVTLNVHLLKGVATLLIMSNEMMDQMIYATRLENTTKK